MKRAVFIILLVVVWGTCFGFVLPWLVSNDTLPAVVIFPLVVLVGAAMVGVAVLLWKIAFKKEASK